MLLSNIYSSNMIGYLSIRPREDLDGAVVLAEHPLPVRELDPDPGPARAEVRLGFGHMIASETYHAFGLIGTALSKKY